MKKLPNITCDHQTVIEHCESNGFTTIELLVTLFIAVIFLISGIQLYVAIIKDGGQTRAQALAGNVAYNYLQNYKLSATNPCTASTPLSASPITVLNLSSVTVTVSITCPYGTASSISKIKVDLSYNNPQNTVSNTTFTDPLICPSGFIVVPGSQTYNTQDFCVMKYEAKQVGATTTPISTAAGLPWVNISQATAIANSPNVKNANGSTCSTCHLITEAEWMTIAQNVLSVASNWDNGAGVHTVGTGYIYSGHNDGAPNNTLAADPSDANAYSGTGNVSPSGQKRTLTLTNGEVIWDLAGNVAEWTAGTVRAPIVQPGITGAGSAWREWTAITNAGTLPVNPSPTATGLSGAGSWNSAKGIGQIISNSDEVALRGFLRGGALDYGSFAGVLSLSLAFDPSNAFAASFGFRVAASPGL